MVVKPNSTDTGDCAFVQSQTSLDALRHLVNSTGDPDKWALEQLLDYNKDSGILLWKPKPVSCCVNFRMCQVWNGKYANKKAGSVFRHYKTKKILGVGVAFTLFGKSKKFLAHRIIWILENGTIPKGSLIDHKDRNPSNNNIHNLRLASHQENAWNRKANINSYSTFKGVHKLKNGRFQCKYKIKHKTIWLGTFSDAREAAMVYDQAVKKFHGEFFLPNLSTQ